MTAVSSPVKLILQKWPKGNFSIPETLLCTDKNHLSTGIVRWRVDILALVSVVN